MNLVVYTPSSDMTVESVNVVGSPAEVTVSNNRGEIARARGNGRLNKPAVLTAGERYYITLSAGGCPMASASPPQTASGVWYVETSKCKGAPCNVAVELGTTGCVPDETASTAQPSTLGYVVAEAAAGNSGYILSALVILALLTITFRFGRHNGHDDAPKTPISINKAGEEKKNVRKITFKKMGEGGP